MENAIPIGKIARTSVAGASALKIGAKKLSLLSKKPFLSRESFKKHQDRNENEIAEELFRGLTKLRGSALKIAQIMSLELGILPEAYRKELYKSHYQVPPLNRALIRRLMISEFGKTPDEVFKTFNTDAFAAASLGQVHEAISHVGERLAVKVQYPGIDSALSNDLQLVKQFVLPFYKTEYLTRAMKELDQRLSEETDYSLELQNTQWFYENACLPDIVIPRAYQQYSSRLVFTTEFLEGRHIGKWLETNPSQAERNQAAQLIYDFFMHSFFKLNKMHSDPNPGNYLFLGDGKIAVIDFGSVKKFEPEFCQLLADIWRAHVTKDYERILSIYCVMGLAQGNRQKVKEFYDTKLNQFNEWLGMPFQQEYFDFGKNPDHCHQGTKMMQGLLTLREMDGFTTETILFDRNLYGLFRIFTELRARVRMRNQWIY